MTRLVLGTLNTFSIKDGLGTADCGLRTGLGIKRGPGIKHGLNIKCGLSLKIAVLTNKYQKMLLFQFSPALLSCRRPNLAFPAI